MFETPGPNGLVRKNEFDVHANGPELQPAAGMFWLVTSGRQPSPPPDVEKTRKVPSAWVIEVACGFVVSGPPAAGSMSPVDEIVPPVENVGAPVGRSRSTWRRPSAKLR